MEKKSQEVTWQMDEDVDMKNTGKSMSFAIKIQVQIFTVVVSGHADLITL